MSAVKFLFSLVLLLIAATSSAQEILMVRSPQAFPEAMLTLQDSIRTHGYTLARVQHVDVGLTGSGYKTDEYRIVFFGNPDEIKELVAKYPQLIPYLPLKMTIFAEAEETLVVTLDPTLLEQLVAEPELRFRFIRWKNDILSMFDELRDEH